VSTPARRLLPVLSPSTAPSRTTSDRLELLTALLNAPTFDAAFHTDVIDLPGDHPVYAWECGVPRCERPLNPGTEFCHIHLRDWGRQRREGVSVAEFLRTAQPLKQASWKTPPPCRICRHTPSWSPDQLCHMHATRWRRAQYPYLKGGAAPDFDEWAANQPVLPSFGQCQVVPCPEAAVHALGLCRRHRLLYNRAGCPGGARLPHHWGRLANEGHTSGLVSYQDETDHFGVRFPHTGSRIDLSRVTQRWLRDLLWDFLAARLKTNPPAAEPVSINSAGDAWS